MEFQKKVAKSGAISIPAAMRRDLGLEAGEHMSVNVNSKGDIVLARIYGTCILCSGHEQLVRMNGKFICRGCVDRIIERNLGGQLFDGNN